jgi:single-stranded-DNA-specific exonuclease
MPAANIEQLRARIDAFARERLTAADFEPVLDVDSEIQLGDVTPQLFQVLRLMEPYGVGNPEPVFSARAAQLAAPPRIMKEKHVKLKVRARISKDSENSLPNDSRELSTEAVLATSRFLPDGIGREDRATAVAEISALRTDGVGRKSGFNITFDALGWRMAERLAQTPLLAGDSIDIAFTIGHNDHPEYGGLELELRDFVTAK